MFLWCVYLIFCKVFKCDSNQKRAAMSVVQIETSCWATAWATGCVWTAHLWPERLCPAWHLIHLKPITRLLLWSPSRKWQWSLWWREPESRTSPQLWSSVCLSLAALTLLLLSQLVAAAAIDIITVLATERCWWTSSYFGKMRFRKCYVELL